MRTGTVAIVLAIGFLAAGCVPSLHPLYTDEDVVFEAGLVGAWVQENADGMWVFAQKPGENAYTLVQTEDEATGKFEVHLVRLGEHLFMDLYPEDPEPEIKNGFYKMHLMPVHTFWKVTIEDDVVTLTGLDPQWLPKAIEEKKVEITSTQVQDAIVLTAGTKELQEFILKQADNEDAFIDPLVLKPKEEAD